ncbi:MAG: 16S rRNA (guanine(527)-N(7))-methyltransferase RsmG [Novosphingobium sp.]|nr:16S rRNA (guanine(527)-N(7))-methyltransferase RsmG [Novosphingobium sp.]
MLTSEAQARAWFAARSDFDPDTVARLDRLGTLLRAENLLQNLVSASSVEPIWVRHFADSAQLLDHVPRETLGRPWLDLGSGAGFPGLVVAVCRPEIQMVLIESRAKRIAWLQRAVGELGLSQVNVRGRRLEAVESFAARVISARAFAPLTQLIALSARFSTPQTHWVLPKGRRGRQELLEMPKSLQALFHVEPSITDRDAEILVGRGAPAVDTSARR